MRGHEEQHAGAEQDAAEDESEQHLPLPAARPRLGSLVSAQGSGLRVRKQTGGLPASDVVFRAFHVALR